MATAEVASADPLRVQRAAESHRWRTGGDVRLAQADPRCNSRVTFSQPWRPLSRHMASAFVTSCSRHTTRVRPGHAVSSIAKGVTSVVSSDGNFNRDADVMQEPLENSGRRGGAPGGAHRDTARVPGACDRLWCHAPSWGHAVAQSSLRVCSHQAWGLVHGGSSVTFIASSVVTGPGGFLLSYCSASPFPVCLGTEPLLDCHCV